MKQKKSLAPLAVCSLVFALHAPPASANEVANFAGTVVGGAGAVVEGAGAVAGTVAGSVANGAGAVVGSAGSVLQGAGQFVGSFAGNLVYQLLGVKTVLTEFKRPKRVAVSEPIAAWNECGNGHGGGITSYRAEAGKSCPTTEISARLANALDESLPGCAAYALRAIGVAGSVEGIAIKSLGVFGERPQASHQRMSLHAAGRAIDIAALRVQTNGKAMEFDATRAARSANGMDRRFFHALRDCWSDALAHYGCEAYRKGGTRGSVGWEDRLHQDHVHLSLPYCPKNDEFLNG